MQFDTDRETDNDTIATGDVSEWTEKDNFKVVNPKEYFFKHHLNAADPDSIPEKKAEVSPRHTVKELDEFAATLAPHIQEALQDSTGKKMKHNPSLTWSANIIF